MTNDLPKDEKYLTWTRAMSEVNAGIVSGFKTAEGNVEDLGKQEYQNYFTVLSD